MQVFVKDNWFKISILVIVVIGICFYFANGQYQNKMQCIGAGEQYYANYVKEQEHNPMFSFDTEDMSHEVAYSSKLNSCLIYVGIKFKDVGGNFGNNVNKFIFDISNSKMLYFMSYGADNSGQEVVIYHPDAGGGPSSFGTDLEFMNKKAELFK